jgi:hypothetical protein
LDIQIEKAHADRGAVPELCRMLLEQPIIIIGSWADAEGTHLRIQDFKLQGESFIPFFSDKNQFWGQLGASPFFDKGLEIDCRLVIPMLHGDELLILNPGSTAPVQLRKMDFEPFLYPLASNADGPRIDTNEHE